MTLLATLDAYGSLSLLLLFLSFVILSRRSVMIGYSTLNVVVIAPAFGHMVAINVIAMP